MSSKQSRAKKAAVPAAKASPAAPAAKASPATPGKGRQSLAATAQALFNPRDKNPYYFNGKPLANLQELADYLVAFTGEEGLWVASWIEYLGDKDTAERIREAPGEFKRIVKERYEELKRSLRPEATH